MFGVKAGLITNVIRMGISNVIIVKHYTLEQSCEFTFKCNGTVYTHFKLFLSHSLFDEKPVFTHLCTHVGVYMYVFVWNFYYVYTSYAY